MDTDRIVRKGLVRKETIIVYCYECKAYTTLLQDYERQGEQEPLIIHMSDIKEIGWQNIGDKIYCPKHII